MFDPNVTHDGTKIVVLRPHGNHELKKSKRKKEEKKKGNLAAGIQKNFIVHPWRARRARTTP
jgi:hypothetical protein